MKQIQVNGVYFMKLICTKNELNKNTQFFNTEKTNEKTIMKNYENYDLFLCRKSYPSITMNFQCRKITLKKKNYLMS